MTTKALADGPGKEVYHRVPKSAEKVEQSKKGKKKKVKHDRGSLKKREMPPKPGTPGYQRWLNKEYLDDLRSLMELEDELLEEDDIVEHNEDGGMFHELFQSDNWAKFRPFLCCTEEEQANMLAQLNVSGCNSVVDDGFDPLLIVQNKRSCPFREERMEEALLEALGSDVHLEFIVTLDVYTRHFVDLVNSEIFSEEMLVNNSHAFGITLNSQQLVFSDLPSSYHRLLLHAISSFYGLLSESSNTSNGIRITTVTAPNKNLDPPRCNVVEYLLSILEDDK